MPNLITYKSSTLSIFYLVYTKTLQEHIRLIRQKVKYWVTTNFSRNFGRLVFEVIHNYTRLPCDIFETSAHTH